MAVSVGWSRYGYNVGAWNTSPDTAAVITGLQANTELNLGFGWSREEWNTGPWNQGLGTIVTGDGIIFVEDGQELTSSVNTISVTASSPISISGEQLNIDLGEETVTGTAPVTITGEELLSATVNTFAVLADGSITINTPTLEANVELGTIITGTANLIDIVGEQLQSNLGIITTTSENIIPISGEELTTTANNITISSSGFFNITGQELVANLGNITTQSENFISIDGNTANVTAATLKFWDPITGNVTEVWTNIH
jgi:hypothetical protein